MTGYFGEVWTAAANTCKGLWLTLTYLFKPAVTIQYPLEKLVPFERFRGALLFDTGVCISCSKCVSACPSACISLENAVNETGKKVARVAWYSIDFGKCNFCRLCEESCPTEPKSVWHSLDYELLFANRDEMVRLWKKDFGLVGKYFDRREKDPAKAYKDPAWQIPIELDPVRHDKQNMPRQDKP